MSERPARIERAQFPSRNDQILSVRSEEVEAKVPLRSGDHTELYTIPSWPTKVFINFASKAFHSLIELSQEDVKTEGGSFLTCDQ